MKSPQKKIIYIYIYCRVFDNLYNTSSSNLCHEHNHIETEQARYREEIEDNSRTEREKEEEHT